MPSLPNQNDDDEQIGATGGSQTVPQTGGGGSGLVGTQAGGGSPSVAGKQKGTGFVNTQDYVKANQGQNFGSRVAGDVSGVAQGAVDSLGQVQKTFNNQADAGTVQRSDNVLSKIKSGNAASVVGNKNLLNSYQTMQNAQYRGPNELSQVDGFGSLAQKYGQARSYLDNTATDQGRKALLGDLYRRPNYTGGMKSLDQTILQADPNSRSQLQDVRERYAGIDDDIGQASQQAQSLAQDRAAQAKALRQLVDKTTSGQFSDLRSALESQIDIENRSRKGAFENLLGWEISRAQNDSVFTPDIVEAAVRKASSRGQDVKSFGEVARDDQIAQYNALAQLLGQQDRSISKQKSGPSYTFGDWRKYLPNGGVVEAGGTLTS